MAEATLTRSARPECESSLSNWAILGQCLNLFELACSHLQNGPSYNASFLGSLSNAWDKASKVLSTCAECQWLLLLWPEQCSSTWTMVGSTLLHSICAHCNVCFTAELIFHFIPELCFHTTTYNIFPIKHNWRKQRIQSIVYSKTK